MGTHRAVCAIDMEPWPCAHVREDQAAADLAWELERLCGCCMKVIPNGISCIRVREFAPVPELAGTDLARVDGELVQMTRYHGARRFRRCREMAMAAQPQPGRLVVIDGGDFYPIKRRYHADATVGE